MKQHLLKTWLMLLCLLTGVGTTWAEDVTSTFTNKDWGVGTGEPAWTKTGANATAFESAAPSRGVQTTLTNIKSSGLSLANSTIKNLGIIKSIKLVVSANGKGGSISSVKVGDTSFKNGTSTSYNVSSSNGQEVTFSDATGVAGDIEITFSSTATSKSLYVKSITVTYTSSGGTTAVTGVSLDKTTLELKEGKKATLEATVAPANATNKNITWSSSKESVATVTDGVVTAVAEGEATITVTTEDGNYTATCGVTVTPFTATYANTYTSSEGILTTTGGTSADAQKVVINGEEFDAIKAGTSSVAGAVKVTVPANTKTLHFHAAGWNNEGKEITVSGLSEEQKITIKPDAGVTRSSPYTLQSDPETEHYYTINTNNSAELTLTFTATNGKRFVLFGVNVEEKEGPDPEKTVASIAVTGSAEELYVGDAFSHNGITVTATYTDGTTEDVTAACAYAGCDMATAGTQTVTVTYQEKTATYSVEVKTIANTQETAYTATEAKTLIDAGKGLNAGVYVKGIVSEIVTAFNESYGNISVNISADGTTTGDQFQLYRNFKGADNVKWTSAEEAPQVGDEVIAFGKLGKHNTTYELLAGNYIVYIKKSTPEQKEIKSLAVSGTPTKKNYYVGDAFETAGLVVTATYTDDSQEEITEGITWAVTPETLTVGTTSVVVTAKVEDITSPEYIVDGLTVTVAPSKVTWNLSINETTTASEDEMSWVADEASMQTVRAKGATAANNYYPGKDSKTSTRFYARNALLFTPAFGITITSIVYEATTSSYATALANSTWANATASANGTTVTITPTDGTKVVSAVIGATTGATSVMLFYTGTVENKVLPLVATDGEDYFATFSSDRDVQFTDHTTTVYVVTASEGSKIQLTEVENKKVPANTGVLIKCSETHPAYKASAAPAITADNMLYPASKAKEELGGCKFYMLAYATSEKDKLGFYWGASDGGVFDSREGSAYLAVPAGMAPVKGFSFRDLETGIEKVNESNLENGEVYNLQGQRVNANAKGIIIKNGKKYFVK